jgi:hypothetical protein
MEVIAKEKGNLPPEAGISKTTLQMWQELLDKEDAMTLTLGRLIAAGRDVIEVIAILEKQFGISTEAATKFVDQLTYYGKATEELEQRYKELEATVKSVIGSGKKEAETSKRYAEISQLQKLKRDRDFAAKYGDILTSGIAKASKPFDGLASVLVKVGFAATSVMRFVNVIGILYTVLDQLRQGVYDIIKNAPMLAQVGGITKGWMADAASITKNITWEAMKSFMSVEDVTKLTNNAIQDYVITADEARGRQAMMINQLTDLTVTAAMAGQALGMTAEEAGKLPAVLRKGLGVAFVSFDDLRTKLNVLMTASQATGIHLDTLTKMLQEGATSSRWLGNAFDPAIRSTVMMKFGIQNINNEFAKFAKDHAPLVVEMIQNLTTAFGQMPWEDIVAFSGGVRPGAGLFETMQEAFKTQADPLRTMMLMTQKMSETVRPDVFKGAVASMLESYGLKGAQIIQATNLLTGLYAQYPSLVGKSTNEMIAMLSGKGTKDLEALQNLQRTIQMVSKDPLEQIVDLLTKGLSLLRTIATSAILNPGRALEGLFTVKPKTTPLMEQAISGLRR